MLEHFYLRRAKQNHWRFVKSLVRAHAEHFLGFSDSDIAALSITWPRLDLEKDTWLAVDAKNYLKGFAAAARWKDAARLMVYTAPGTQESDLFLSLTVLAEGRARALVGENESKHGEQSKKIVVHVPQSATHQQAVLTEAGYRVQRTILYLARGLDDALPIVDVPEGLLIRSANAPGDIQDIYAFSESIFGMKGRPQLPYEFWAQDLGVGTDWYDPELWHILEWGGEIAGCALGFVYGKMGWIRRVAVREDLRGRGLGRALLLHGFSALRACGLRRVGLAVAAQNEKAMALYHSAGMKETARLTEFSKTVGAMHGTKAALE